MPCIPTLEISRGGRNNSKYTCIKRAAQHGNSPVTHSHTTATAMPRNDLTEKQKAFARYIRRHMAENNGEWPYYKDFLRDFGWQSPNSVTQNIRALVRKGVLIKFGVGYKFRDELPQERGIAIKGVIAAGQLQEAVEANLGSITLQTLFPEVDRMFALRVSGQSMAGADIHSGDYVLLVDDDIPNGGIGAILYNGETSLKRIYMDHTGLRLEPANPEFDDIRIEPDIFEEVTVLGRYVGHVNRAGIHKRNPTPLRRIGKPKISRFRPS